jgi:hypothetical protein
LRVANFAEFFFHALGLIRQRRRERAQAASNLFAPLACDKDPHLCV